LLSLLSGGDDHRSSTASTVWQILKVDLERRPDCPRSMRGSRCTTILSAERTVVLALVI